MRVCIMRQPNGVVEGVSLARLLVGECYDLSAALAEYLVLNGYAIIELRSEKRTHPDPKPDRRRYPR